jgi:hypothetical protein
VTEAVKRPQPDADSAAVEQPDADAVPADRRRRVNVRPGFTDHARRVTRVLGFPGAAAEVNAANEAGDANVDAAGDEIAAAADAAAAAAAAAADDDDDDYLIGAAPDPDEDDAADERRSSNFAIKCSLKKLVCLPGDDKANFINHVSEIVAVMSKLRVRACQTLTLFFMHTLSDPRQFSDDFFGSLVHGKAGGDKFWREALRDSQKQPDAEPEPVLELLRHVRRDFVEGPELTVPDGVSGIVNSVARELSTAFRNHLSENFFERQLHMHRAFVLRLHHETAGGIVDGTTSNERKKAVNELAHWLSRRVNVKESESVDFGENDRAATRRFDALGDDMKVELQGYAHTERATLGLDGENFVSRPWLRSKDPARVIRLLRWTWTALIEIERFLDNSTLDVLRVSLNLRVRKFCICPQAKIHAAHVPIDAFSFFRLGCSLRLWGSDNERFTGARMIKTDLTGLEGELRARGMSQDDIKARVKTRRAELERDVKNRARREFWCKVLKVNTLRHGRPDLDFAGHVRTDGVSISVLFDRLDYRAVSKMAKNRQKAETILREATPDELAMQRIIGIDPGRTSICYATEEIVAAAPNDEARQLLFDGPPAMNVDDGGADEADADDADAGGAGAGGAGAGGAGVDDDGADEADADEADADDDGADEADADEADADDDGADEADADEADADDDGAGGAGAGGAGAGGAGRRARRGGRGSARARRRRHRARRKDARHRRRRRQRRGRGSRGIRRARRSYKAYNFTRAWYYRRAGIDAAKKQSRRWLEYRDDVREAFQALSRFSVKTTDFEVYRGHVDAYIEHFETLWTEKLRPRWARQKFRLYCGKRRAQQEFVNGLRGDEIPLIAYGAARFASGGRGERSVPVKGMQRLLRQTYPTVLVDEYNTSKMCPTCHVPLQHVKVRLRQRDESWKTVTCHDLRRCGNRGPGGCALLGCSWKNRDEAASLNIGRCARLKALKAEHDVDNRPAFLRRRAPGEPKHPDATVFLCRPVDDESGAPKKIGRGA